MKNTYYPVLTGRLRAVVCAIFWVWVSLGAACTQSDVFRLYPPAPLPEDKIVIEGTYCASEPESLIFPVKILFIMDDSGSMAGSDPTFRRLAAARELIDALIDTPETYFGVERFQDGEPFLLTTNPTFTRDRPTLDNALADAQHQPAGWTPYVGALSTAVTAIANDMDEDPILAIRTRYIVLFLSDGEPTDEEAPYARIYSTVEQLKALEQGSPAAGEVTLHTSYLQDGDLPNAAAISLLQEMARLGEGQFKNFENGDAIDFSDFDVTAISRDYRAYFPVLVTNLNTRPSLNGYLIDSDTDGLPDIEEEQLGTDPTLIDTDGDGCSDLMEVKYARWDPLTPGWETDPVHCDCTLAEQTTDSDGDGLTDCEEKWLSLDPKNPDSDADAEGKSNPDHMLDRLEVLWNLGRTTWDANEDYDVDGFSNLVELSTHMDPNRNDNQFREELAYVYDYVNQQTGNQNCYDFRVSNVRVMETLAVDGHPAGENNILLYFIEAPQDNPYQESIVHLAKFKVRFNGKEPSPSLLEVQADDFRLLGTEESVIDRPDCGEDNCLPVADAGADFSVEDELDIGEAMVTLDASGSYDPDGRLAGYLWRENGQTLATSKVAELTLSIGEHEIELVVMDEQNATATDWLLVEITAPTATGSEGQDLSAGNSANYGCASAGSSPAGLWLSGLVLLLLLRRRTVLMLSLLSCCLLTACGPTEQEFKTLGLPIINGAIDTNPDHNAVVALRFDGFMCSGTLISPEVILTAAHCVDGYRASDYTVYFGADLNQAEQRRISELKVHPGYSFKTVTNDIALLRLSSPPPAGIVPIPYLPPSLAIDSADLSQPLEYVGFGETETGSAGVKLTITSDLNWICTSPSGCTVGSGYPASANTICGDLSLGGTCHGDSGGPAFVFRNGQEYVAGITSYGDEYCDYYGCSTKVDEFQTFIGDFVGGELGSPCTDAGTCLSGLCVDGVCCQSECQGTCMACNALGTCGPAPNGTSCSDGDACNGEEKCLLAECVAAEAPDCNDDNPCTADACDAKQGCVHEAVADASPCPDEDLCNGEESCQAGVCTAGPDTDCNDHNPCTEDSCDAITGCLHLDLPYGDDCGGGLCGPSTCQDGYCIPQNTADCDDDNPCTQDACDPELGCTHEALSEGSSCGGCMTCQQTLCQQDDQCVITAGCASITARPSAGAGSTFLLWFVLCFFWRRRFS